MSLHSKLGISEGVHTVIAYTYANSTERLAATGFTSLDVGKIAIQSDNNTYWILNSITPTWIQIFNQSPIVQIYSWFGDGYDGNLTLSGSTVVTFTKDMYYDIVTIPSGITGSIITSGFQLFCNTLDLRGAPANSIKIRSTYDQITSGIISGTVCGGAVAGANGTPPTALTTSFINGGFSSVTTSTTVGTNFRKRPLPYLHSPIVIYGGAGGTGASGQTGGAGAGVMRIFARTIITNLATSSYVINAAGGAGSTSGTGGGGGYVEIWYETRTGPVIPNLINVSGGAGSISNAGGQGTVLLGNTINNECLVLEGNHTYGQNTVAGVGSPFYVNF